MEDRRFSPAEGPFWLRLSVGYGVRPSSARLVVTLTAAVTNVDGSEKKRPTLGRPSTADAHSRGHGMAQVALSRAKPSSPHRPPSRSSRGRPFTFTSAIARELADRAALARHIRYKGSTSSSASCVARTQWHVLSACHATCSMRMCFLCTLCAVQAPRCLRDPQNHRRSGQCM